MRLRTAATAVSSGLMLAIPSALASGSSSFADTAGDGSPDVRQVTVSNDDAGRITFRVDVDELLSGADVSLFLSIDADRNAATGIPLAGAGIDYLLLAEPGDSTIFLARIIGNVIVPGLSTTGQASSDTSGITVSIDRSELGATAAFAFQASFGSVLISDDAPDTGTWTYTLRLGPAKVVSVSLAPSSTTPRAGKPFTFRVAQVVLESGEAGPPETTVCKASLAGRGLRGSGPGSCTWRLPKTARAKALAVAARVAYRGATATRRWTLRVR